MYSCFQQRIEMFVWVHRINVISLTSSEIGEILANFIFEMLILDGWIWKTTHKVYWILVETSHLNVETSLKESFQCWTSARIPILDRNQDVNVDYLKHRPTLKWCRNCNLVINAEVSVFNVASEMFQCWKCVISKLMESLVWHGIFHGSMDESHFNRTWLMKYLAYPYN